MIKIKTEMSSDNTIAIERISKMGTDKGDPKMAERFKLMTQDVNALRERQNNVESHWSSNNSSSNPTLGSSSDDSQLLHSFKGQGGDEFKSRSPGGDAGIDAKNNTGGTSHKDYLNRFDFDQLNSDTANSNKSTNGTKKTSSMPLQPEVLQHIHAEDLLDLKGNLSTSTKVQDALELKISNGKENEILTAVKTLGGELGAQQYLSRFEGHDLLNMSGTLTQTLRSAPMVPGYLGYANIFQANQLEGGHYARFAQNSYSEQRRLSVAGSAYEPVYRSTDDKASVYFSDKKSEAVVAFRGADSSDWGDILKDAQDKASTSLESFDIVSGAKAQAGFYETYLNQKEGVNTALNNLEGLEKVTYTGHGAGAAVAQVAGLLAGIENETLGAQKNIYIEAYNSPNAGNRQLQDVYQAAQQNNIISSNVYNTHKDPISALPTSAVQLDSNVTTRSVANAEEAAHVKGRHFHDLRLWNMGKGVVSAVQIDQIKAAANESFDNVNDAAIAMLTVVNPISIAQNLEWGGLFYELNNKVYSTLPIQGTKNSVATENRMEQVPENGNLVGNWHTHGDWTDVNNNPVYNPINDVYNSDEFSSQDIVSFNSFRANISSDFRYGYLGTPSGELKRFDLESQQSEKV